MHVMNPPTSTSRVSRRKFLQAGAAAIAAPMIIPGSVLGKEGRASPSNRITIGCIGMGMMGMPNMDSFLGQPDTQVLAVSDLDKKRLENAKNAVNNRYNNKDCMATGDFREIIARNDIDALSLALPDHWHSVPAIMGARAGKDMYGENPLSHTVVEGRAMCDAVKMYGRVWQTGSWQRSVGDFPFACELVLNGRIGKLHTVEVGLPSGTTDFAGTKGQETFGPPPADLDYETWLGPAPWAPYCPARVHANWRWHLDYGGGQLMDWIGHHCDIAHWGMGMDYGGPLEVEGTGEYLKDGLWNSATKYKITAKYPNDMTMIIAGGYGEIRGGTKWIGTDGWVWVDRGGFDTQPKSLMKERDLRRKIALYRSPGHHRNFLDCVKSRKTTLTPAEVAHRSATPGHLGQIAMILGRRIKWDPKTETIENDETATRMLGRAMREPWQL
jgi:predicted dehydrogenase